MAKTATSTRKWTVDDVRTLVRMYAAGPREHADLGLQAIARKLGRSVQAVDKKLGRMIDGSDTDALDQLAGEDLSGLRRCCQRLGKPLPRGLVSRIEDAEGALLDLVDVIMFRNLRVEKFRQILSDARYTQVKTLVEALRSV